MAATGESGEDVDGGVACADKEGRVKTLLKRPEKLIKEQAQELTQVFSLNTTCDRLHARSGICHPSPVSDATFMSFFNFARHV